MGLPDIVQTYRGVVYYIYEIHRKDQASTRESTAKKNDGKKGRQIHRNTLNTIRV